MFTSIRPDDPRILNPTFDFNIPWNISNDAENIINVDDDDIFMCTQVSNLVDNTQYDADDDLFMCIQVNEILEDNDPFVDFVATWDVELPVLYNLEVKPPMSDNLEVKPPMSDNLEVKPGLGFLKFQTRTKLITG